jgi:hypothetical protein
MNRPQDRIPEEKTQEVFTLAAQLYAQHNQSYSVQELMEAGAEAKIPPEFIQQAVEQIQLQRLQTQHPVATKKPYLLGLALGLPILAAVALAGWLLPKNVATNTQANPAPISGQPQVGDATQGTGNFKCANLSLVGQDLSGQNLKGADCTNAKLGNANLKGVNLEGANLSRADLKNADLSGANLKGADLANADLSKATLSDANLEGANLGNSDLRNANLGNANLRGVDLAGAKTEGANLSGIKK